MTSCFLQHWKREQRYQHDVFHDEGASSLQSANNLKNLQLERIDYCPLFPTIWWNVFSAQIFANMLTDFTPPVKMSWLTLFLPSPHFATYHFFLLFSCKILALEMVFKLWLYLFWSVRLVCPMETKDLNYIVYKISLRTWRRFFRAKEEI